MSPAARVIVALLIASAIYVAALFPVLSLWARHPDNAWLWLWRWVPDRVMGRFVDCWGWVDPHGYQILGDMHSEAKREAAEQGW